MNRLFFLNLYLTIFFFLQFSIQYTNLNHVGTTYTNVIIIYYDHIQIILKTKPNNLSKSKLAIVGSMHIRVYLLFEVYRLQFIHRTWTPLSSRRCLTQVCGLPPLIHLFNYSLTNRITKQEGQGLAVDEKFLHYKKLNLFPPPSLRASLH